MTLPKVTIDEAGAADAARLAALHAAAFAGAGRGWTEAEFARLLALPGHVGLIATADGEDAGLALHADHGGEGEILTIGVAPRFRRRGIGGRLLGACMTGLLMGGARRVVLEVAEDNAAALALYRSACFARIGRRRGYYARDDGTRVDAIVLAHVFGQGCGG